MASVTAFRSSVLVGTCAAILAVDFPLFPLRLAKTHDAGTGLMDLGAGAFIFAHGESHMHACAMGPHPTR
jgi:phosphatidylinositol glycan class W